MGVPAQMPMKILSSHADVCDGPNFTAKMRLRNDMNRMPTINTVYIMKRRMFRSASGATHGTLTVRLPCAALWQQPTTNLLLSAK
jgi:hypothetical protein